MSITGRVYLEHLHKGKQTLLTKKEQWKHYSFEYKVYPSEIYISYQRCKGGPSCSQCWYRCHVVKDRDFFW